MTAISATKKLIGIFGGTFDPVHRGHINAVLDLQRVLAFDAVHWVLSARPPHKVRTSATIEHRFEMLQLALSIYPDFVADDTEIRRADKSWTIDTVLEFMQQYPEHHPCLIIGGDSLQKLHTWRRFEELIELASFVVMARPGYELIVPPALRDHLVQSVEQFQTAAASSLLLLENTDYAVSATNIRELIATEGYHAPRLSEWLVPAVQKYIQKHQPYTQLPMQAEQVKDQVVEALEDVKGVDIRVIDIAEVSDFADFMVVVSGTSDTHVKALARESSDRLRKQGIKPLNEDGQELGEWVLVDFGDVVLHVMRPEVREYYDLEKLWDQDFREMLKQHREQQGES